MSQRRAGLTNTKYGVDMEDQLCAECGIPLSPDEAHVCDDCAAFFEMTDPNSDMTGGDDG